MYKKLDLNVDVFLTRNVQKSKMDMSHSIEKELQWFSLLYSEVLLRCNFQGG
jgi:hypothetical protein